MRANLVPHTSPHTSIRSSPSKPNAKHAEIPGPFITFLLVGHTIRNWEHSVVIPEQVQARGASLADCDWAHPKGREILDRGDFDGRQPREQILQILKWIDPVLSATAQQGIDHRAAFPGPGRSYEQPVTFSKSTGTNGVLDEVVVDLQHAVVHKPGQCIPAFQRAINGLTEKPLWQGLSPHQLHRLAPTSQHRSALSHASGSTKPGHVFILPQIFLHRVEQADPPHKPTSQTRPSTAP